MTSRDFDIVDWIKIDLTWEEIKNYAEQVKLTDYGELIGESEIKTI